MVCRSQNRIIRFFGSDETLSPQGTEFSLVGIRSDIKFFHCVETQTCEFAAFKASTTVNKYISTFVKNFGFAAKCESWRVSGNNINAVVIKISYRRFLTMPYKFINGMYNR